MKTAPTNEPLCSLELSKALREAGFDWVSYYGYTESGNLIDRYGFTQHLIKYTAPNLFQAQLWLIEQGINVYPIASAPECEEWAYLIYSVKYDYPKEEQDLKFSKSLPEALEAGLLEAIKLIKI